MSGRSGCGVCGVESLEQVRPEFQVIADSFSISHDAINRATENFESHQPLQSHTGAVHGAAWCNETGEFFKVCEDVGRHNALDKLVGSLWNESCFKSPGFLLMSSRASFEIVMKAAKTGIAVVVAVSAPTSLAIEIADQAGITLVGFSRNNRHVVYANKQRLIDEAGVNA